MLCGVVWWHRQVNDAVLCGVVSNGFVLSLLIIIHLLVLVVGMAFHDSESAIAWSHVLSGACDYTVTVGRCRCTHVGGLPASCQLSLA